MSLHRLPLSGETICGLDATILGWGQSSSFIEALRRFVDPRMVNRMISLTGSPRMPHSSISHQGQLLLWGISADPDASCYWGEPCIIEGEAASKWEMPWVVCLWLLSKVGNRLSFAFKRWVLQRKVYISFMLCLFPVQVWWNDYLSHCGTLGGTLLLR